MKIKIGTRQSALALKQTEIVCNEIKNKFPEVEFEIVKKQTSGDINLSAPLIEFGGKGAFVSEFEEMLLSGQIDIAVHSAKDLPSQIPDGLEIGAVLPREDPRDVLIYRNKVDFYEKIKNGKNPVIGTSSLRREIQIRQIFDCEIKMLRGNVPTRLEKLKAGEYDAIILAAAGLKRLGFLNGPEFLDDKTEFEFLSYEKMLPAGGQGIVAIENSKNNAVVKKILSEINHEKSFKEFLLERNILCKLNCGCHEPTAVFSQIELSQDGDYIKLSLMEEKSGKTKRTELSGKFDSIFSASEGLFEKRNKKSCVYLIGAGPGDEGLITEEGKRILRESNAVVFDNLANPLLLQEVSDECRKIFVGKIPGSHSKKQEEINRILVEQATKFSGEKIVRLKGGDSFVFGRGGEEILELEKNDIPYIVIPGITSAISALESAGIPVTHRKEARSFHVITGHTASVDSESDKRYVQYAGLEGTLVFLMGVAHLGDIVEQLVEGGKNPETPVSIVEQGTTIRQRRTDGKLSDIVRIAAQQNVKNPAVICVGEVAKYRMKCENFLLASKKIAVTGTCDFTKRIGASLKELGASTYCASILKVKKDSEKIRMIPDPEKIGWIIFTSGNGVRVYFEYLREQKIDLRKLGNIKFCVVGNGTQKALESFGFSADFVPAGDFTVEQMAVEFSDLISKENKLESDRLIVSLRACNGSDSLNKVFARKNIPLLDIGIYSTVENDFSLDLLMEQIDVLDYVTFGSSSGVKAFFKKLDSFGPEHLNPLCRFVCIGSKTYETLMQYNLIEKNRILVAEQFTAGGIVEAIKNDKQA